MNGTRVMNDDEALVAVRKSLVAVRDSLGEVRMDRPVEVLFSRARARRLRRAVAVRAAVAIAVAAATAAGVLTVNSANSARAAAQARASAYVTGRVERALAREDLVFAGSSYSKTWGNTFIWAYGSQSRFEEFMPTTDYRDRIVNGQRLWDFPPDLRGQPAVAVGTALVAGKLTDAYVTYDDHRFSLSGPPGPQPTSACSTDAALSMGGPLIPTAHWLAFINATLACGAAKVTGLVRINGAETTMITGKPVTVRLSAGYGKSVGAKWATARWILYVNPKTFLPVRMYGSTETFGGPAATWVSSSVTNVQWLPPTAANIAMTLVTIPAGFQQVSSPNDQS